MRFSHDFVLSVRKILISNGLCYNLETKGLNSCLPRSRRGIDPPGDRGDWDPSAREEKRGLSGWHCQGGPTEQKDGGGGTAPSLVDQL